MVNPCINLKPLLRADLCRACITEHEKVSFANSFVFVERPSERSLI